MVSNLVYYAMGGGLGHVVRARAFLHTVGYSGRATLLTASEFAGDARVVDGLNVLRVPIALERDRAAFRRWLMSELERLDADCLCVDTFPAGILGELGGLSAPGLKLWHVARLLRWDNYAAHVRCAPPRFERCWRVEPLNAEQLAFLDVQCERTEDIELRDPRESSDAVCVEAAPFWLVVHSGPQAEVAELIAYAHEVRELERVDVPIHVLTPNPPAVLPRATRTQNVFPAQPYLARAERVFTAAGFNITRQTARYREKQSFLPMPRRYDDQYERARRATREV